jgi:hypothetical protein
MPQKLNELLKNNKIIVIILGTIIWSVSLAIPLQIYGDDPSKTYLKGALASIYATPIFLFISFIISKLFSVFKKNYSTFFIFSIITVAYCLMVIFKFG